MSERFFRFIIRCRQMETPWVSQTFFSHDEALAEAIRWILSNEDQDPYWGRVQEHVMVRDAGDPTRVAFWASQGHLRVDLIREAGNEATSEA